MRASCRPVSSLILALPLHFVTIWLRSKADSLLPVALRTIASVLNPEKLIYPLQCTFPRMLRERQNYDMVECSGNRYRMGTTDVLIPGLPNDLGLAILARVPRREHARTLVSVCSAWRAAISSKLFLEERKRLHCAEPWVYMAVLSQEADQSSSLFWFATSTTIPHAERSTWWRLPAMPQTHQPLHGFQSVVIGNLLYVIGGFRSSSCSLSQKPKATNQVSVFNAQTSQWSSVASMLCSRANFACGVIDGLLYVSGGERSSNLMFSASWSGEAQDSSHLHPLMSAEVFNPASGRWDLLPPMEYSKHLTFGTVLNGKFVVSGFHSREYLQFEELTEAYDPSIGKWQVEYSLADHNSSSVNQKSDPGANIVRSSASSNDLMDEREQRLRSDKFSDLCSAKAGVASLKLSWHGNELILLGDSQRTICIKMGEKKEMRSDGSQRYSHNQEGTPLLCEIIAV